MRHTLVLWRAAWGCSLVSDLSGATSAFVQDNHAKVCRARDHDYVQVSVHLPGSASAQKRSPALVGACISGCKDGSPTPHMYEELAQQVGLGCRDFHPTAQHVWPAEELGKLDGYHAWIERILSTTSSWSQIISWESLYECPAASCVAFAVATLDPQLSKLMSIPPKGEDTSLLLDLSERMDFCYDEILANPQQQEMMTSMGFMVPAFEIARAQWWTWAKEIRPRNPHHEEGRLVWRDYYSGLYAPVNYSAQFDLQWQLALEGSTGFSEESSVRLDNCTINDMILSTFGQSNFLHCAELDEKEHERKERGISRQNFVVLDVSRFKGATALDVGCGFGRWTMMLQSVGAKVTSVDASPHAVKSTRRFNPDTHQMTLFELPTLKNYEAGFDLVICWGVLHHTHDPLRGFQTIAAALREGGVLFIQVYNDRAKAGYHFTQSFRARFHKLKTVEEKINFLRATHRAAGADIFDHLDGMLTFYNWVVHEETVRNWFLSNGFADYWKVWNYKYLGRKRPLLPPVRDDYGILLRNDLGESIEEGRNYPLLGAFAT